jgi:hypothetical protein
MIGIIITLLVIVLSPFILFFCFKFAALGYYQAKKYMEKEAKN